MGLEESAQRLIRKFGENRTITLVIPTAAPADPNKPWDVDPFATTTTIDDVPAVILGFGIQFAARPKEGLVDGGDIRQGDEVALVAGPDFGTVVPTTADKVIDRGIQKNIITIGRVRPGQTDFLWKLQLRTPGVTSGA